MKRITGLTILTALVALWTLTVFGAVPQLINFQGILKDGSGNPVANGSYSVVFTIYDAPTAGTNLWSETQSVTTTSGLFNTLLGSVTPIAASVFDDSSRYLGIKVGADPEMTPRQKLSSVGFSYNSAQWTSAAGNLFRLNGNVGIGTSSPSAKLDVGGTLLVNPSNSFVGVNRSAQVSGAEYFGIAAPVSSGMYGGMYISTPGVDGWPFYGYSTLSHTAWTYLDGQTGNWYLYANGGTRIIVDNLGYVGMGAGPFLSTRLSLGGTTTGLYAVGSYEGLEADGGTIGVDGRGGTYGVYGYANVNNGYGVYGDNGGNSLIYGGYFRGDVYVNGNLGKAGGGFKIDDPIDPANKYLEHSFVESPDMKNIYDGIVVTDSKGNATVTLPDWFGALNRDFRYQLTVIGEFAQAIISKEIANNQFSIETNKPNVKVSWQVTGIRQDVWANAHRIPVEEAKPANERGSYLHPELFGQPEEKSVEWARNPEAMRQMKAKRPQAEQK